LGLLYGNNGLQDCNGYSYSDWAEDTDDHKSTSGYLFQMSGAAISWRSKKHTCVALSTAEVDKYMASAFAVQEAIGMGQFLSDLRKNPTAATHIFEDNQSAIILAKNPQFHGRAEHIGIKYHFNSGKGRERRVEKGNVELQYCPTEEMVADMLTNGLSRDRFVNLRVMCRMKEMIGHYPYE